MISLDLVAELIAGVEQDTFLLTHDLDSEALVSAALATGATGVQPYGLFADEAGAAAAEAGLMVLRPVGLGDGWKRIPSDQYPLFDSKRPDGSGNGGRLDLDALPKVNRPHVIAGGLTPNNVGQVIESRQPFGVDVSSGVEIRPGQKDHALLAAFAKIVRETG